jgi:microcystin-dependent protein
MIKYIRNTILTAILLLSCFSTAHAQECMLGEVKWFGGNFAPRGWALAEGQLLPISQNSALFSILGTTYGGDGETTFALPDLRGRSAMGTGSGPGLTTRRVGEKSGSETTTLSVANIPSHSHNLIVEKGNSVSADPDGKLIAKSGGFRPESTVQNHGTLHSNTISPTGGDQSFSNMQPYLVMNPIICLTGIFPSD